MGGVKIRLTIVHAIIGMITIEWINHQSGLFARSFLGNFIDLSEENIMPVSKIRILCIPEYREEKNGNCPSQRRESQDTS